MTFQCKKSLTLLNTLKLGIKTTYDWQARHNEFHGGPAATEYLLTTDILRAFIQKGSQDVYVEYNIRKLSPLTKNKKMLSQQRIDLAIVNGGYPEFFIEIKTGIGKKNFSKIKKDILKIIKLLDALNGIPPVLSAFVFELYWSPKDDRKNPENKRRKYQKVWFENEFFKINSNYKKYLEEIRSEHSNYKFYLRKLDHYTSGPEIVDDDGPYYKRMGYITAYYALLMKKKSS